MVGDFIWVFVCVGLTTSSYGVWKNQQKIKLLWKFHKTDFKKQF